MAHGRRSRRVGAGAKLCGLRARRCRRRFDGRNGARIGSIRRAIDESFARREKASSAARNTGVSRSSGRYLALLDSDDLWLPGKLARQTAFMIGRPDVEICQTEEIWIRNGVRVNPKAAHRKPSGDVFLRSLDLCLVSPSAVMMTRELFERAGGFDESFPVCEDYDLWLRIAAERPIPLIPEALVVKRGGHADQLSRSTWGMDRYRVRALQKLLRPGIGGSAAKGGARGFAEEGRHPRRRRAQARQNCRGGGLRGDAGRVRVGENR